MFTYLFPIFAFGLVITGVVFLGLQRAADLAKDLAAQRSEAEKSAQTPKVIAPERNSGPVRLPAIVSRH